MKKSYIAYSFFFFLIQVSIFGQKTITLDDIWTKFTFYTKTVPGFNFRNDGLHYSKLEDNIINEYDLRTGASTQIILSGEDIKGQANFMGSIGNYSFSPSEDKILIASETENIYRRSSRSNFHVYNISAGTLVPIYPKGKIMYATFSPSGNDVAFVFENNLYSKNLTSGLITQITFDGKYNEIINGAADWVYEEEFSMSNAFFWSPEGDQIAYLKFDESKVKEFTITKYTGELYPQYETFKYPKVGEDNSVVSVHLYNLKTGKRSAINLDEEPNYYIPRIKWTNKNNALSITALNRHQNHLKLYMYDVSKEKLDILIEEKSNYYIDIHDNLLFLPDNKQFIWSSDLSGYHHLYLYNIKTKEQQILTKGDYEVTDFYGYDPKRKKIFFQSSVHGPEDRQVCKIDLVGDNFEVISNKKGWNSAQFNNTYNYYTINFSDINTPPSYTIFDHDGQEVRIIEDNDHIHTLQKAYNTIDAEFFELETSEKVKLNGWMIKPPNFDSTKKYPLFMFVYGGPGSQQVTDSWKGNNYWWFQLLAEKDYIVACVDNRGTGGRGEEFRKMTYLQLGHYETKDQIEAAMYLGRQAYVDAERIGIFGWSYGGFMATNALLKGSEVFKAGIAVAPVTNWKWYDSIYTERYMKTVAENPDGYRLNSPVYYADRLKGAYLLVHGIGDDNVHFQHSAEMMNALIKANKQYENYSYPNRNHGIYGDNARLHLYTKMTDFIMNNI